MKRKHSRSKKEEDRLKAQILAVVNQAPECPWTSEPERRYLQLKPKMRGELELSDAGVPGRPMVSIMVVEDDNVPDDADVAVAVAVAHLDVREARKLVVGLERFIRHVTNPKYYRNCTAYRGAYEW